MTQETASWPQASPRLMTKAGERITPEGCNQCALRYSWVSLLANSGLALLKIIVGLLAGSRALVASALYSVNDILSGSVVIISMRVSRRRPNEKFSYGYGNAEYIAIGVVSVVVMTGVLFLLVYSAIDVIRGGLGPPHPIAIPVAVVSLGANYYLAKRGDCIARRTKSPVVETAAQHNYADAEGSLLTFIGVGGATLGFHAIDPIVAIVETLHIVWLAARLFGKAVRGLLDSSLPPSMVLAAARAAGQVRGVRQVVAMRTRQSGAYAWIDAEIEVEPSISLARAHDVCQAVSVELDRALPHTVKSQVKFRVPSAADSPNQMSAEGADLGTA